MTPSRNSVIKSDILTRSELVYCALAALGLHFLLVCIFCKEQNMAVEQNSGNRTNILFSENDPNFKSISQKIKAEPDPTQFIRGGNTGYSSCYDFTARPEPESKSAITGNAEPDEPATEPPPPELNRSYAQILQYSPPVMVNNSGKHDPTTQNKKNTQYPIWKDAFGVIQGFGKTYGGYNSTISINSSAIAGPTVLKIQFPPKKSKNMPIYISVHHSCGDTFLDDYAKNILLVQITNAGLLKKFNPDYNDMVYVYWQPDLKPFEQDSFPQNMFPGDKL